MERGFFRLSLVASALLFLGAALLAAQHWAQRHAAWKEASTQPPRPPVILLAGGGFVILPAGMDPKQALASILTLKTLPDETQAVEWKPGCWSENGKVFNLDGLLAAKEPRKPVEPTPAAPQSKSAPQPSPKPSRPDRWWEDSPIVTDWQDLCLYRPLSEARPVAGYLEDGGRLYSRRELLAAEAESALSRDAVRSLERARSSGVFPRAASEPSWRDAWQVIGLCLSLGAAPLALFAVSRWILRGFAGG